MIIMRAFSTAQSKLNHLESSHSKKQDFRGAPKVYRLRPQFVVCQDRKKTDENSPSDERTEQDWERERRFWGKPDTKMTAKQSEEEKGLLLKARGRAAVKDVK